MQQYVDHSYNDYGMVDDDDEGRLLDKNAKLLPTPASSEVALEREELSGMRCTFGPMKKNTGGVMQPFPGKVSVVCREILRIVVAVTFPGVNLSSLYTAALPKKRLSFHCLLHV